MSRVKQNQKEITGVQSHGAERWNGGSGGTVDAVSGPECQDLSAALLYEFKERLSQKSSLK
jgi:hypothetical protein